MRPKGKTSPGLRFAAQVFTWMESFCWIREKSGAIIPFVMNPIQQILAHYVAECWHKRVAVRVVLVKSRQQGSSTFWDLLFTALAELKPGYQSGIIAHDDQGAEILFNRVDTALRNLEKAGWGKPDLLNDQGSMRRWTTESMVGAGTIKTGDALGKGGTPNALHFSESANYADQGRNANGAVISAKNGMVENEWTVEVHESTAKGKDAFFYPLCEEAGDPDSTSAYHLIFFPWFLSPEYSMTWEQYRKELIHVGKRDPGAMFVPTPQEIALRERLATTVPAPHERHFRYCHTLTDEQLIWRRHALYTRTKGDETELLRYFPSFYEDCFAVSAVSFFESETIHHYRNSSRSPITQGTLVRTPHPTFAPCAPPAPVKIWEYPKPHHSYVLAVDPGGERVDRDPSCAYVINKANQEMVAQIYGHLPAGELTTLLHNLGLFYNKALVVVENNFNPVVANDLHRQNYPNLYYFFRDATIEARVGRTPGFQTNSKTRPEILGNLRRLMAARIPIVPDPELWKEMETFIFVPKAASLNPERDGKYQAVGRNHDDRIMALALALFQCPDNGTPAEPEPSPDGGDRAWQFFQTVRDKPGNGGVLL